MNLHGTQLELFSFPDGLPLERRDTASRDTASRDTASREMETATS